MTAIPADIQKAASAVYAQLGRGPDADEQTIAKALLARDERAAVIADDHAGPFAAGSIFGAGETFAASKIAAAIRSPQPSPTPGA